MFIRNVARAALILAAVCVLTGGTTAGGGNKNKNKKQDEVGGKGEAVKSWQDKSLDEAKKAGKPMAIYIYDPADKKNTRAKLLEGPEALDNGDVKAKLSNFLCVKLTDNDKGGWPANWLSLGKNGAALIFTSSDMNIVQTYDRSTPKEQINPQALVRELDLILKYEEAKKAQPPAKDAAKNDPKNDAKKTK